MFGCPKSQPGGFRVGIHDSAAVFRLKLEGPFTAAAAHEVESCWTTARSTVRHKKLVVDLSRTTSVDAAGRELLLRLHGHGAEFVAGSDEMARLVSGITGSRPPEAAAWPLVRRVAGLFARLKLRPS
jgi:hypothetical protein